VKVGRTYEPGDRYRFDFKECRPRQGWAQVDTSSDACYYGNWANPSKRMIVSYAEGDVCRKTMDTDEEFVAEMRALAGWLEEIGYGCKVDVGLLPGASDIWDRLGLSDLLH